MKRALYLKTIVALVLFLATSNLHAQQELPNKKFSLFPSYNIGKSKYPEDFPADSIPLFVLKGNRKSKKISPATTLKLAPKGNNITYLIPEYIKEIHILKGRDIPGKYRKDKVFQVYEIYILDGKFEEVFGFLRGRGYFKD